MKVLENENSTKMLNDVKELTSELKKLQADAVFWITKNNQYGKTQKEKSTSIFKELEKLCSYPEKE